MNAILGFSQLLSDSDYPEDEKQSFVRYINQGSESLLHLIEDILDFSMIEANQLKIQINPFRLDELLEQLHSNFLMYPKNPDVEFRTEGISQVAGIMVDSDRHRLNQIISNLLSNALKFTKEGHVELGIRQSSRDLIIYVKDTGDGIRPEEAGSIYSEFVRLERHEKSAIRGVGLGLAITRRLTDLLNFELSLDSTPGEGAEFQVQIPLEKISQPKDQLTNEQAPKAAANYNWEAHRILIAEDNSSNVAFLQMALAPSKIQIDWANDGKEAVHLVEANNQSYDLILMDINMPEMNGYEALAEILQLERGIPVIAQTAHTMPEDRARLEQAQFTDQLFKPIKKQDLLEMIAKSL